MKIGIPVSIALFVGALALALCGSLGVIGPVAALVGGVLCLVFSVPPFLLGRHAGRVALVEQRARELLRRGVRVEGTVEDALPLQTTTGPVFQAGGAQMLLRVRVDRGGGGSSIVTVHIVEQSSAARLRIGTTVTVLEHPDDPAIRALAGYMPNGRRAA